MNLQEYAPDVKSQELISQEVMNFMKKAGQVKVGALSSVCRRVCRRVGVQQQHSIMANMLL